MDNQQEINLIQLIKVIWDGKYIISLICFTASIIAVLYSLSLSDIYRSQATLSPVSMEGENSSGISSQLGSLAGLAGVSFGANPGGSQVTIGMEVMQSRRFFNQLASKYDLVKPLMAGTDWDRDTNTLIYDEDIYDIKQDKWIRVPVPPLKAEPSMQEAYREFSSIFSVSQDDETGIITLRIENYSPYLAKEWLDWIIFEINNLTRNDDMAQAEKSIEYLKDEINQTNLFEIKEGISQLIQAQIEKIMLAKVTPEYLFKIIDPPYLPEVKAGPSRALICVLGFFLGLFVGILFVIVRYFFYDDTVQKTN
jgi:uncharacterized protein involved in exopolysaccharide biosynthesis